MKFDSVSDAYKFYKNTSVATMESRAKAIQAEIAGNVDADLQALGYELEAIENAMNEKREDGKPADYTTPESRQQPPVFTASEKADRPADSKLYRSAFHKSMLGNELTADERRLFEIVNEKRSDEFNQLSNSAAVVPTKLFDQIITKARDEGGLLSVSRGFNLPANLRFPIATPTSAAEWHDEGATVDAEEVKTTYIEFASHELMKVLSMSVSARVMTLDSFESYLADELAASIMTAISQAMVDGDGNKKGTGILTGVTWDDTNTLTVPDSDWLGWRDVLKAVSMLHRGYSRGARFVMSNRTLYNSVYALHNDDDTPLYLPSVREDGGARLVGLPVTVDDFLPDDTILLGNFGKYMAYNMPMSMMLDVSRDSSFRQGKVDYRALCIADCKPIMSEPFVKIVKGA